MKANHCLLKVFAIYLCLLSFMMQTSCVPSSAGKQSAQQPQDNEDSSTSTEVENEDEISQSEMKDMLCPASGEYLVLTLDHTLTIDVEGANLTHILHAGNVPLGVIGTNEDGQTLISSDASTEIPYEMLGSMGDCNVEMHGTISASASGFCMDGVVYLSIIENWQPASGTLECDNEKIPFQSPGPGAFTHAGKDGSGEIFYLEPDSDGYTLMREFQYGPGYHSWTLYYETMPPLPLIP